MIPRGGNIAICFYIILFFCHSVDRTKIYATMWMHDWIVLGNKMNEIIVRIPSLVVYKTLAVVDVYVLFHTLLVFDYCCCCC